MKRRDFIRVMVGGVAGLVATKYLPAEQPKMYQTYLLPDDMVELVKSVDNGQYRTGVIGREEGFAWHDIEPIFKARSAGWSMYSEEVEWKKRNALLSRLNSQMAHDWSPAIQKTLNKFGIG